MRRAPLALFALILLAAPALAQGDAAAEQAALQRTGAVWVGVTFVLLALGAGAMWWVNHLYHPPGEKQRAKSRRD